MVQAFPSLSLLQMEQLQRYADLVATHNRAVNLVSRKDVCRLWEHHILPSLIVLKMSEIPDGAAVVDVGTGAGFPGIPLKIVRPDLRMALVDSIRKKTLFLYKAVEELALTGVKVYNERLEPGKVPGFLYQEFQVVLARAVTNIKALYSLAQPLLKENGLLLAWKGESDMPELKEFLRINQVDCQVLSVPSDFQKYSDKFRMLRIIRLSG